MADNYTGLDASAATITVAADEITSVKYPRVKLTQGADGTATDVSSAAPLEVTLANGSVPSHAVTNAGTFAVQAAQSGTWTVQPGNTANTTAWKVDGSAVTQPVSNAGLTALNGAIAGTEVQVDVLTMPTVAVTQSGTWDEVGINDSGNSITVDNAQLSVVGGGTEAAAMRVTIASDSTGVLSVDDNGGNLSIDDGGNSITVDYATTGSGTATGALRVELPTNGTGVIATVGAVTAITNALPAGTNAIGKLAANSGVDIGDVDVTSISAGSNLIGDVSLQARTTGATTTIFRSLDLDETEEEIKATAGAIYGYYFANVATSVRYLKFYNATAANVTVGTTTPVLTFPLPASSAGHIDLSMGVAFGTAITAAATTGVADNDTGAPSANDVILNVFYK